MLLNRRLAIVGSMAAVASASVPACARASDGHSVSVIKVPADLVGWSRKAAAQLTRWLPAISGALAPRNSRPVKVRIAILDEDGFIAFTNGDLVAVSAPYARSHPRDLGMLAHEAVHVAQAYPRGSEAWVTEGIADHVRYYVVEKGSRFAHFDVKKDSYKRGYQPAAAMLDWIRLEHDGEIVRDLDLTLLKGRYASSFWTQRYGRSADALWKEFVATRS